MLALHDICLTENWISLRICGRDFVTRRIENNNEKQFETTLVLFVATFAILDNFPNYYIIRQTLYMSS